jgi:hypothetical protein
LGCRHVLIYDATTKKGEGTTPDTAEKAKDLGKRSLSKKESLLTLRPFPIPLRAYRMILFKTGGRREVNISIFFLQAGKKIH